MKEIRYWMLGLVGSMMLFTTAVQAKPASQKLDDFIQSVVTFQASFEQVVFDSNGQEVDKASGTVLLERPGKFRWDYVTPYPQQIVADGNKIWFYDVDLEQVTVKAQSEALLDTPATLLSGEVVPAEKYEISDLPSEDVFSRVQLTPKDEEAGFQTVMLVFGEKGLYQMIMRDNFDQTTQLTFSDIVENNPLVKGAFLFTPPEGVDVVGE